MDKVRVRKIADEEDGSLVWEIVAPSGDATNVVTFAGAMELANEWAEFI